MKYKKKFLFDLQKLIKKIKKKNNKIIVFQTEVIPTARHYQLNGKFVAQTILKNLEKNFSEKTILFPAFSNDLIFKKKYDLKLSKPYTGIIPNLALISNKYFRTESPLHSFLTKGKMVDEIEKLNQKTTWGSGSVFEWLYNNKALWVSLNLELSRGCAVHHMSEEIAKVPYRFYKNYKGKLFKNNKFLRNINEKKFSYYLKFSKKLNFNKWTMIMRNGIDFKKINISKGLFANISLVNKIVDRSVLYYKKNPLGSLDIK